MTVISRYILSHYRRVFLLALASFVGLYLLIDFFDKIDNFVEHGASLNHYLGYFSYLVPVIIFQIVPLAVLLASFLTLGGFSRTQELTAMRSGGLSLTRIATPIVISSVVIALFVLLGNELVAPHCYERTRNIYKVQVKGNPETVFKRNNIWFREGNAIVKVRHFSPEQDQLKGISIFNFSDRFRITSRTDADEASFAESGWTLGSAKRRRFDPQTGDVVSFEPLATAPAPLQKSLQDMKTAQPKTSEMSYRQLRGFVRRLQAEGYDATRYRVDMEARLAQPVTCIIMALLAIPFALQGGRRSNLAMGIGITLLIGISYFILQATLLAFGYSGVLPPLVSAWAANLIFSLLGFWLLLHSRY